MRKQLMEDVEKCKNGVLAKMREQKIKDFTDEELKRVFKNCVAPTICFRLARRFISDGNITGELNYE